MREIKFRAWDKQAGYMLGGGGMQINATTGRLDRLPSVVVMQYTGRKDMHSKEIFNGDLVNCRVDKLGELPEQEVKSQLVHYDGNGNLKMGIYSAWFCHHEEVIGNIYENPELIKEV